MTICDVLSQAECTVISEMVPLQVCVTNEGSWGNVIVPYAS